MAKAEASTFGDRAWRLLRLALLWARRGGAFRRGAILDLRRLASAAFFSRSLRPARGRRDRGLRYGGEREFSFDETPAFRFKRRLPRIPCITPAADHFGSCDDDDDSSERARFIGYDDAGSSGSDHHEEEEEEEEEEFDDDDGNNENGLVEIEEEQEGGNIDLRAEEFIAKFYQEMKFQRQISWIQYNEMLERSVC